MKKHLITLLFAAIIVSRGLSQITLEHVYDSASTYALNKLFYVDLEISGGHFVNVCFHDKTIRVYDLNHSLTKSKSYAAFPQSPNGIATILYFSEGLFDPDPAIEFMYLIGDTAYNHYTSIYKEDGTRIFYGPNEGPWVFGNVPQEQQPIYNTPNGAKMLLSRQYDHQAKVYSLPGTLSTSIHQVNQELIDHYAQMSVANAHPNPASETTTIDYLLPAKATEGEIVFFFPLKVHPSPNSPTASSKNNFS